MMSAPQIVLRDMNGVDEICLSYITEKMYKGLILSDHVTFMSFGYQ